MTATTRHLSPRASLAALGLRLRRLGLFEAIALTVKVPQETVRHTPAEKLHDAFVAILPGAHGLSEINTRLRADPTLQRSFGRSACAEYSLVQDTLDACTPENVEQLRHVVPSLFRAHSRASRHDYTASLQVLDLDMTGLPSGPEAELSRKGYFSKEGIRCGRQLGHDLLISTLTPEEVLTLLGTLAHNVLVWAREWLGSSEPRLKQYGVVRLLRDMLGVSGFVETDRSGAEVGVVFNRGSILARLLAGSLWELLHEQAVAVSLGGLSDWSGAFYREEHYPHRATSARLKSPRPTFQLACVLTSS